MGAQISPMPRLACGRYSQCFLLGGSNCVASGCQFTVATCFDTQFVLLHAYGPADATATHCLLLQ